MHSQSMAEPARLSVGNVAASPNRVSPYVELPAGVWALFGAAALLGLTTVNPLLTAVSILAVPVFMSLLWRRGEAPVLLFAVGFQWLQVTARVFHANVQGVDVAEFSKYAVFGGAPSIERAVWMGLLGLVVLAVGMRLGMRKLGALDERRVFDETRLFSTDRAFILYLVCTGVATLLESAAWGSLVQLFLAASKVKWVAFFVLGYLVLKRRERYLFFAVAVVFEFIAGIGFFSEFKTVFFITFIVIFTVYHHLRPGVVVGGAFVFAVLLVFGAAWTSIKGEYREFLNQGSGSQAVLVSQGEQLAKLGELVGTLSWDDVTYSMGDLFDRVSYVDYFAIVMDYVPEYTPHENGELWKTAFVHVLTPRALYPSKPPLTPDSEVTMRYTGLQLASTQQGSSISIGYMGESYVDFGPYGMYVPIFLLGILWGVIYSFFVSRARSVVMGFGFATACLLNVYQFEMTGIKMFGGILTTFIVLSAIMFFFEKPATRWIEQRSQALASA